MRAPALQPNHLPGHHTLGVRFQYMNLAGDSILFFTASDLASLTSHIHNWIFLLWLHPFILSGVISPLISSSILGPYQFWEFLFKYPIILPFHTVHGVLKARILKGLAIPFSGGPHSVSQVHESRQIGSGQTRDGKGEHQHSRNQ